LSDVNVREVHLDLTVPENRAAFERVFLTTGPLAHPKTWAMTDGGAMAGFVQRVEEDGLVAEFEYDAMSGELGGGFARYPGSRRGMWGIFPKTGASERDLREARYMDMRQDDPRFQPLRSCTEPSTGQISGGSPNTGGGRPPGSP
jgi:hypothetical protein